MKKTVTKLKAKHRQGIWRDEEGDFWYWDAVKYKWCVLMADYDGGFHINRTFDPIHYSHFKRVAKSALPLPWPVEDR